MNWGSRKECQGPNFFRPRWYTNTVWQWKNFWNLYSGIRKKYSVRCQISRWKLTIKCSQHKLLFNLVKDLFKWIEGLGRSVTVWVQSKRRRFSNLGGIRRKYSIRCQISRSKNCHIVFQHKLLFNLVKDLFKWIEGLERSVMVRVQSG